MNAHIITVGNELLIGDITNTNASEIGRMLTEIGISVTRQVSVGDKLDDIKGELHYSMNNARIVIVTGGLGPTHDDVTKEALLELFGEHLVLHEPSLKHVKKIFDKRGLPFSRSNYQQAMVPANCDVIFNKWGTAPGMWFRQNESVVVVLPGVPHEMTALMHDEIIPRLQSNESLNSVYRVHYFKLAGIGESTLSDLVLSDAHKFSGKGISLAFLPHTDGLTLRISSIASSGEEAVKQMETLTGYIRKQAREFIFSEEPNVDLSSAVGRLLKDQNLTVSTAESCTGGYISNWLTDIPGSSDYFKGAVVAYSNQVKMNHLNVLEEDLDRFGAVSQPVALQMSAGVAGLLKTDIGLSATGIAGPGGGTADKPVGTVWIGFWSKSAHFAVKVQLTKDRLINKQQTAMIALDILRRQLSGIVSQPYQLKANYA